MKVIIFLALLILATFAVHKRPLTSTDIHRLDKLKSQHNWGSFLVNLAELHLMTQGPVDALVNAIRDVVADLATKEEQAHSAFDRRTNQHNTEIRRLTDLINSAKKNIADTQENLNAVLVPQREQLTADIADLNQQIANTIQYISDETVRRRQDHESYLVRQEEYSQAVEALNECLELLEPLTHSDGQGVALVQIRKAKKSVEKLTKHLPKLNVEVQFIKALAQLATEEFANVDAVVSVMNKMRDMRDKFTQNSAQEQETETAAQAAHEADMAAQAQHLVTLRGKLTQKTEELARTEEQIEAAKSFIEQRKADQARYEQDFTDENEAYDRDTAIYNDLIAQFQSELSACNEALDVISNATFEDYIGSRMDSDVVMDDGGHQSGTGKLPSNYQV